MQPATTATCTWRARRTSTCRQTRNRVLHGRLLSFDLTKEAVRLEARALLFDLAIDEQLAGTRGKDVSAEDFNAALNLERLIRARFRNQAVSGAREQSQQIGFLIQSRRSSRVARERPIAHPALVPASAWQTGCRTVRRIDMIHAPTRCFTIGAGTG